MGKQLSLVKVILIPKLSILSVDLVVTLVTGLSPFYFLQLSDSRSNHILPVPWQLRVRTCVALACVVSAYLCEYMVCTRNNEEIRSKDHVRIMIFIVPVLHHHTLSLR